LARCGLPAGVNAPQSKNSTHRKERTAAESGLLLYPPEPRLLRFYGFGDSEFDVDDSLGWNFDLLLRLGIEACTCLPLLLYELAKTRQDEFAVLFSLFVCERAERNRGILQRFFCWSRWQQRVRLKVQSWSCLVVAHCSFPGRLNSMEPPRVITLDGYAASHRAVTNLKEVGTLPRRVRVRSCKYLNNIVEQDDDGSSSESDRCLGSSASTQHP